MRSAKLRLKLDNHKATITITPPRTSHKILVLYPVGDCLGKHSSPVLYCTGTGPCGMSGNQRNYCVRD